MARDSRIRPFADLLVEVDAGRVHDEASIGLHELIEQAMTIAKAGSVSVTIAVAPDGDDQMKVAATVLTKLPKAKPRSSTWFLTTDGNLSRAHPAQERLPLREVPNDDDAPAKDAKSRAAGDKS